MSTTNHTPGPWHATSRQDGGIRIHADRNGRTVLVADTCRELHLMSAAEEVANATLMAAAPDAHAILAELVLWFNAHNSPRPDAMFDDARTWRQVVLDYLAKAGSRDATTAGR